LIFALRTNLQSVKHDWEAFRFYKLYRNLFEAIRPILPKIPLKERLALSKEHLKHDADSIKIPR